MLRTLVGTSSLFALSVALLGCESPGVSSLTQASTLAPAPCTPDSEPNDGLDDRVAIQDVIDAQGCAFLAPGVWDVGVNPGTGTAGIPSLTLPTGAVIRGVGPATILNFEGDAGNGDWRGIRIAGDNAQVTDLTVDSSDLTNTEEQTHAIEVLGPASAFAIERVWLKHPPRPGEDGGDCVRLLGEDNEQVNGRIVDNHFVSCDRSGIAIQRGVYGVVISGNTFLSTGDQDIDAEMTSTGVGGDWTITNNVFLGGLTPGISVSLAGDVDARRIVFANNVMYGRGLHTFDLSRATIANNVIVQTYDYSAIQLLKVTSDVNITGNVIMRTASSTLPVIAVTHHNSGNPGTLTITGNRIAQSGAGAGLYFDSLVDGIVSNNMITTAATSGTFYGVQFAGIQRPTDNVVVSGNTFRGPFTAAVFTSGAYNGQARLTVTGNSASGPAAGLICNQPSLITGPVVSSGNNWAANSCTIATAGQ